MTQFDYVARNLDALKREMCNPHEDDTPMDVYHYAVGELDKALMDDVVSIGWWKREHKELDRWLHKALFGKFPKQEVSA